MSELRVFISNLPEKFTQEDLLKLLSSANVSPNAQPPICEPVNRGRNHKTRYSIISFDNEDDAKTAKDSLNGAYITTTENGDEKKHILKVNYFISSFKEKTLNNNICIRGLPDNFEKAKVEKAYKTFGKILSAEIHKVAEFTTESGAKVPARSTGYVLFNETEEANKAIASTNGKFLGKSQVIVTKFISRNERLKNPCTIYMKGLPPSMSSDSLEKFLKDEFQSQLPEESKFTLQVAKKPTVGKNPKYPTKWAIVELISHDDAKRAENALENYVFSEADPAAGGEAKQYPISVGLHYTPAAIKMKNDEKKSEMAKNFKNERSVFVSSVRSDVKSEEFKAKIAEIIGGDDAVSCIEHYEPVEDHTGTGRRFRIRLSSADTCKTLIKAAKDSKTFEGFEFETIENGKEIKRPVSIEPFEMKNDTAKAGKRKAAVRQNESTKQ